MGYKVASFEWGSVDPNEILKKHESKKSSSSQSYHSSVSIYKELGRFEKPKKYIFFKFK
jgi:hypothetical protein